MSGNFVRVERTVRNLTNLLAGEEKDRHGIHKFFWSRVAYSLFDQTAHAYLIKSNHGTDNLGVSWPDHDQHTKAYHIRPRRGDLSGQQAWSNNNKAVLGILSKKQDKYWRNVFGVTLGWARRKGMSEEEALELAGRNAWVKTKQIGGKTKWDVLGTRELPIMMNSTTLFSSINPGRLTKHTYRKRNKNQVYRLDNTGIEIGTEVEYADRATKERPIWADDITPWVDNAIEFALQELTKKIANIMARGGSV